MEQRAEGDVVLCIQGDAHIEGDPTLDDAVNEKEEQVRVLEGDEDRGEAAWVSERAGKENGAGEAPVA